MIDDLKYLLELNKIDIDIYQFSKKKNLLPDEIEELEESIEARKVKVVELSEKLTDRNSEKKSLETEVDELKSNFKKSEEKLMSIKTNAEYDAVHTEIESHKKRITVAEERILQIMSELEKFEPMLKAAEDFIESDEFKEMGDNLKTLTAELGTIETELSTKDATRDEAAKKISPKYINFYERFHQKQKDGRYIGISTDARRSCGICGYQLTPQRFILVKRNNDIQTCESCGAILVWQGEMVNHQHGDSVQ